MPNFIYMTPNNAMNACGFRASAANENLKRDAQTQVAETAQAICIIYDAVRDYT